MMETIFISAPQKLMEPIPNLGGLSLRKLRVRRHPPVTRLQSVAPAKVCRGNPRIFRIASGGFIPARIYQRPEQLVHSRTSTEKTRCKNSTYGKRDDKGIAFNGLSLHNNCCYRYTFFALLVTYAKQKYHRHSGRPKPVVERFRPKVRPQLPICKG